MGKTAEDEVRAVLQKFQDGYAKRDPAAIEDFMQLFSKQHELEVIGTNGVHPGMDEWYTTREGAQELVKNDWESWGDLAVNIDHASVHVREDVAWLSAPATVTMVVPAERNYQDFLEYIKNFIDKSELPPQEKLLYVLRGGANTLYELYRGERFVWPLRFTAVLVKEDGGWKFIQMQFSLPTVYFPDVRVV